MPRRSLEGWRLATAEAKVKKLHVAAAQIHSGGGPAETLARAELQIAAAAAVGADLILFSETCLHGYDYDLTAASVRRLAEPYDGPNCRRAAALARKYRIAVLMGFWEKDGARVFNSHLVAWPDGRREVQRKHSLTAGERQAGVTACPAERRVFVFGGVRTVIIICADGGMRGLFPMLHRLGVQYRFCPTAGGGRVADMLRARDLKTSGGRRRYQQLRQRVFKAEAIMTAKASERPYIGFASANALGPVGKRTCHQGHCMIVDNDGIMRGQIAGTPVLEHQQDQMIHALLTFA